jgi:hypothetical protein
MITPTLLRARSLDETGAGIPHAGISEGAPGKSPVLPKWHENETQYRPRRDR